MSTPGSRATNIGLTVTLVSVSASLIVTGFLVGASLIGVGVRMADGPPPIVPVVFASARALAAFMRRNTAAVGLVMASCAVTVLVSGGEAHPVLCFATFALLLLGVSLISIGARGE